LFDNFILKKIFFNIEGLYKFPNNINCDKMGLMSKRSVSFESNIG
jgi:hypothetical protein